MCEDMVDGSEWEHKFSQSSEWVDLVVVRHHGSVSEREDSVRVSVREDLVVVRHHGSVHRDDMSGRVCVSVRRQCERYTWW